MQNQSLVPNLVKRLSTGSNVDPWDKVRHKGKQVVNPDKTKPPFGRSWFKS